MPLQQPRPPSQSRTPLAEGRIAVVGLGYVGLPTAAMMAVSGARVLGIDTNPEIVNALLDGNPPTAEPEIRALVNLAVHSGNLEVGTALENCDAYVIAVPTPVKADHTADLSYVRNAVAAVADVLTKGQLVVVESTVPPGTMHDVVLPELKHAGFGPDAPVLVAHCPERVRPGATLLELTNNDRVIGGLNQESGARAAELYKLFVKGAIHLTDLTTAEFVKVMENTYRDVNVALANEFAKIAEGIEVDVWQAIELANNHPRVNILRPGPGVGGHCVAVDPWFLVQLAPTESRLISTARDVNDHMPAFVVEQLFADGALGPGHVAVLGLAYRADIGDTRESPALRIVELLESRGVEVRAHDPLAANVRSGIANHDLEASLKGAAAIVVATDHASFKSLDPFLASTLMTGRLVVDSRRCLDTASWAEAGFRVRVIGRPAAG